MGELTVPVLTTRAKQGHLWAVDDLAVVGTPAAATALAELLWSDDPSAVRSAWHLASLLRNPDVEQALRHTSANAGAEHIIADWIWKPFAAEKDDPLIKVAGRVYVLLSRMERVLNPVGNELFDPRIGLPLALNTASQCRFSSFSSSEYQQLRSLFPIRLGQRITEPVSSLISSVFARAATEPGPSERIIQIRDKVMSKCTARPWLLDQLLLNRLTWPVVATIFGEFIGPAALGKSPGLRREDWSTVLTPRRASAALWWIFGSISALTVLGLLSVAVIRLFQNLTGSSPFRPVWAISTTFIGLGVGAIGLRVGFRLLDSHKYRIGNIVCWIAVIVFAPCLAGGILIGARTLFDWLPSPQFVTGFALLGLGAACGLVARHRDRVNNNVFRRCFDAAAMLVGDRTSIIAQRVKTTSTQ